MSRKSIALESGYDADFDNMNKHEWHGIINCFSDSSIYQTWSYDAIRCGEKNISHLVLKLDDRIVAVAQARIFRLPILGIGAAYVRWGPLWQMRSHAPDPVVFRMALRALRNEYVCKRGLILRIFPVLYDDNAPFLRHLLEREGYFPSPEVNRPRTLLVDLEPPLEQVRKRFDQKWRNCLNKAERNRLEVFEGTDDTLFSEFIDIYKALLQRKNFEEPNDINEFRLIQRDLPAEFKMRIFLCLADGCSSAGAIFSAVGETGVYLFGATNNRGMANKGSYLLQWKGIEWMKNSGCLSYNLNGINPINNPGSYHFKAGIAGKTGKDLHYIGRFDCYSGVVSCMLAHIADAALPFLKYVISSALNAR